MREDFIDDILDGKIFKAKYLIPIKLAMKARNKNNNISNILTMRNLINNLSECISKSNEDYSSLIIIEDLDRCKHDFALKLFEISKHIFNSKSFIIIYFCDWDLMNSMVSNNKEKKSKELYLDRIIDFVFTLKQIDVHQYLFNKYLDKIKNILSTKDFNINRITSIRYQDPTLYFYETLANLSIRKKHFVYQKIYKFFERQKDIENLYVFPELYDFLLSNNIDDSIIDNENIFYKFFNKKRIDINDKTFIVNALSSVINYMFSPLYESYIKENKYIKDGLKLADLIDNKSNYIDECFYWIYDSEFKKINDSRRIDNRARNEIFSILNRDIILSIIQQWFNFEFNKY